MRVRVEYEVDVSDHRRRAINAWYGRPGLATPQQVAAWYEANGHSMDLDLDDAAEDEG